MLLFAKRRVFAVAGVGELAGACCFFAKRRLLAVAGLGKKAGACFFCGTALVCGVRFG